jgi:hypothetical protein
VSFEHEYGMAHEKEIERATTAMQVVLICKRVSKPSGPLDRDLTVGHI